METLATFGSNLKAVLYALNEYFFPKILISWGVVFVSYMVGVEHIPLLGALTTLVAIDFVTGIYSAYKTGETIESRKAIKTAVKWTLYMLMISGANLAEGLIGFSTYLAQMTIAFLGATELISILENIGRTGVAIPKKVLNKLQEITDKE